MMGGAIVTLVMHTVIYELKRPYDHYIHFVTEEQQNSCHSRFKSLAGIGRCGCIWAWQVTTYYDAASYVVYCDDRHRFK